MTVAGYDDIEALVDEIDEQTAQIKFMSELRHMIRAIYARR